VSESDFPGSKKDASPNALAVAYVLATLTASFLCVSSILSSFFGSSIFLGSSAFFGYSSFFTGSTFFSSFFSYAFSDDT